MHWYLHMPKTIRIKSKQQQQPPVTLKYEVNYFLAHTHTSQKSRCQCVIPLLMRNYRLNFSFSKIKKQNATKK